MNNIKKFNFLSEITNSILNCYAQMFFSKNRIFALLVFTATFISPISGLFGLLSIIISLYFAHWIGYDKNLVNSGLYSFNSLMIGLFIGLSYNISFNFFFILISFSILSTILSNALFIIFKKYDLPILGLPFLLSSWLILYNLRDTNILTINNADIYFYNKIYETGGDLFVDLYNKSISIHRPIFIETYFRSLGAIYFQFNLIAGILIAIGLLFYSRIAFMLSVIGYTTGYLIFKYIYGDISQFAYGYIGFNYILAAISIGGFYLIPSFKSFLLAITSCILIALLHSSLGKIFTSAQLPLFSLPGTIIILLILLTLKNRFHQKILPLVTFQKYVPELNLYEHHYKSNLLELNTSTPIGLPFHGTWTISQGHHGSHTHKEEWAHAWDFIIEDEHKISYKSSGEKVEDYFCYDVPVIAPADGYIIHIIDGVDDNDIGKMDTVKNWGNTIIIQHAEGIYSKISHLKKGSFKNYIGEYIYKGQTIASCGNSGRSPYPHIHFQIQSNAMIGAKTLNYPLSNYLIQKDNKFIYQAINIPKEKERLSNIQSNELLTKAFYFIPGTILNLKVFETGKQSYDMNWEVFTNAYNVSYFYCNSSNSFAYFNCKGSIFYFSDFIGDETSLLYQFYIGAHKILLGNYPHVPIHDKLPIFTEGFNIIKSIQDLIAPFFLFINTTFKSEIIESDDLHFPKLIKINSTASLNIKNTYHQETRFDMVINEDGLSDFIINKGKTIITINLVTNYPQ